MQQIRDPIQVKKFLTFHEQTILVLEHGLFDKKYLVRFENTLIDAITIQDSIVLLFQDQVSLYSDNQLTNKFQLNPGKRPYKLFYAQNLLYISDFIKGIQVFDITATRKIEQKINGKVLLIQEQMDSLVVFYQNSEQQLVKLENGKEHKINCQASQLILTQSVLVIYSYMSLKIYDNKLQEIADYSNLISEIVQVHDLGKEFLIISNDGSLATLSISNNKVNHKQIGSLKHRNILTTHIYKNIYVISQYGLSVYDQNFQILYEEEYKYFMSKIFEFQDNLYVTKNNSKLFQIKSIRKPIFTSTAIQINKEIIKFLLQKGEYYIIITNQRVILYNDHELDQLQFQTSMIIDSERILLSDNEQILLLKISDNLLQIQDKYIVKTTIIKKVTSQSFSCYTDCGYIEIYDISNSKICFKSKSSQFLDLSAYHYNNNQLVVSHYNNLIQIIDSESQFELKSIAIQIDFFDSMYYVITQTGQLYLFNINLQLNQLLNLFGNDVLVEQIFSFNNQYLISDATRHFYYVPNEEAEIISQDQLLMDNLGNLFTYKNSQILSIQLTNPEYDFVETSLFDSQESIYLIKNDILITDKYIYHYQFDSFQQIYQLHGELTSADIQGKTVALLLNYKDLIILRCSRSVNEITRMQFDKNHQTIKLSKDILIATSFNEVNLYKSNKKLESFKAIFPDNKIYEDNQILQIHVEFHNDTQLMIDLLIDQAGIVVVLIKILGEECKLSKKFHAPINMCQYTRMQMIQNTWETFNTLNQCQVFKQVQFFFDGCLKQLDKPTTVQDIVVDSIVFKGMIFYLGVAGALWKQLL